MRGDARRLGLLADGTVDAVVTSPPYLSAIDYLRGHKLALVWLGHSISELREIRSGSIGSERSPGKYSYIGFADEVLAENMAIRTLDERKQSVLKRYVIDMIQAISEMSRVIRTGGRSVIVVGSSNLQGKSIDNAYLIASIASRSGLTLISQTVREIPQNKRYLPPPSIEGHVSLGKRMRFESVLAFMKA